MVLISTLMASSFCEANQELIKQLTSRAVNSGLHVEMKPIKAAFEPNEAIKFNIKGNKDFFLYVFAINEANQTATMMLPNTFQKGNKYTANHLHRVPNATEMELVADKPGVEKIIMLASTKYIEWDTTGYSAAGRYLNTDNKSFKKQLKAISARPIKNNNPTVPLVKELLIKILGDVESENTTTVATSNLATNVAAQQTQLSTASTANVQKPEKPIVGKEPLVFSAFNKNSYKIGEDVYIIYGADRVGYTHLYLIDSKKKYTKLATQKVDGNSINRFKAKAAKPKGRHKLVVVWSELEKIDESAIPELKRIKNKNAKGFSLVDKSKMVYRINEFKIK